MQVLSRCPLEVGSILWLPRAGAYTLTVVAKATFRLAPEVSPLADEQDPVIEADSYWDHDEGKSLDSATDLVPRKRFPEVLLTGHAYAPQGTSVGGLVARITVCEIDKAIEITGDRHFKLDGTLSHPGRFSKMPLRWERAAGGPDTSNPVGVPMGDEAQADGWGRVHLPNLIPSGHLIASRGDIVPPACFAPIAPTWPGRLARLHRHAAVFSPHGWHARPMPPDLDMAYFNAAPPDQLVREILGTERFTLENLHPHYPLLSTRLPNAAPRATVDFGAGSTYEVPFTCDTLLIDTDRCVATLTYRAEVQLDYPERQGWVIVTSDTLAAQEIPSWAHAVTDPNATVAPPVAHREDASLPFDAAQTGALPAFDPRAATPFEDVATGALPAFDPRATPFGEGTTTGPIARAGSRGGALPFARAHEPFEVVEAPLATPADDAFEPEGDDADYDEEETFASVRGDAPFPIGARPVAPAPPAPRGRVSTSAAPMVPPKVPQGPRLGAFRLQGKSDVPPAAEALDFTDAPTDEPRVFDDAIAPRAPGIPTPPPLVSPRASQPDIEPPPLVSPRASQPDIEPPPFVSSRASQPDVEPPPFVRRTGTAPMPERVGSSTGPQIPAPRASDAGMPFVKTTPGKVQPGRVPPGKIAPLAPGVPPPPPSTAGREPPTFGFGRPPAPSSPALGRAAASSAGLPFGAPGASRATAHDSEPPPDSTPFQRPQTLPTPGLYPKPAMPFGAPAEETGPVPQASAMGAAETLPGPMSFAALTGGPAPAATPFGGGPTPLPGATPFGGGPTPLPGAPFGAGAQPLPGATPFGAAPTPAAAPYTPASSPPAPLGPAPYTPASSLTAPMAPAPYAPASSPPAPMGATPYAAPIGGTMGVLGAPQGMTIGERIPAARAPQGMTIGEMVAQQRLPLEPPRAPSLAEPEATPAAAPEPPPAIEPPAQVIEPPRIGPLATPEMVATDLGVSEGPPSTTSDAAPEPPPAPPPPPAPAGPEPLPLEKYPLERCARIAASVTRTREKKAEILETHELDDARWEPLRKHWLDEIKKDTERGKTERLKAYDTAFVAQLEEERGPIAVEEYARLVVAAERGTASATLQELSLPDAAMLRIQRVWMAKMGKDPDLRRLVQSAVEAASES